MKNLLVACLFATVIAVAYSLPKPDEKYTNKYDSIDLDSILRNKRLLTNYIGCLRGLNPCSPDGAELKKVLPDALQNKCVKCSETQKEGAEKSIRYISAERPEEWKELLKIYDPKGEYRENYAHLAQEKNIKI